MSGFNNPIIGGGGALIYPSIHSPNYVPLISGWSINKDGTAQFSSINVLGGALVFYNAFGAVIFRMDPPNGAFFAYLDNGSAVQGQLVGVQAVKSGVDPVTGTAYSPGNYINDPVFLDFLTILGNTIMFGQGTVFTTNGQVKANQESVGVIGPYLEMGSPIQNTAGGNGQLKHRWYGDKHDGSILASEKIWRDLGDGNVHAAIVGLCGQLAAMVPGTAIPGTLETWHGMTGAYTNAWSDTGGGNNVGRYRLLASPPNTVEIEGTISHAGITGASAFFTLPAGYRPASSQLGCVWVDTGNHLGALSVATTGIMTLNNLNASTIVQFHGFISLD